MGQFIIIPNGKLLVVNGGGRDMAAYSGNGLALQSWVWRIQDIPITIPLSSQMRQ